MSGETKGLLASMTIWGGGLALLPEIIDALNAVIASGLLPAKVAAILHTVGGLLAIFGRLRATKEIKGFV